MSEDRWVSWSGQRLAERIEEVTVDAYGDYEQLGSFACVFEELLGRPVAASVVGVPVELIAVSDEGVGTGLRAEVRRGGRTWQVALFDVSLGPDVTPELDLTVEAYRRWARGL